MVHVRSYGPSASGTTHDFTVIPPSEQSECERFELDFSASPGSIAWFLGRSATGGSPEQRQLGGTGSASQVPAGAYGMAIALGAVSIAAPSYLRVITGSAVEVTVRLVAR